MVMLGLYQSPQKKSKGNKAASAYMKVCLRHQQFVSFHSIQDPVPQHRVRFMENVEKESPIYTQPTELDAQKSRKTLVEEAVAQTDWSALRELSLLPGGFDGARTEAW